MYAKALRELGPVPYEMMVANAQHSYVNRPRRAMTCVGLLKPRRAADGAIQFTPSLWADEHEEDNLAERQCRSGGLLLFWGWHIGHFSE